MHYNELATTHQVKSGVGGYLNSSTNSKRDHVLPVLEGAEGITQVAALGAEAAAPGLAVGWAVVMREEALA